MSEKLAWAVVPAGGRGERFSHQEDKLTVKLDGAPILVWSVLSLLEAPGVAGVVIACQPDKQTLYRQLLAAYQPPKLVQFAPGGRNRRESVYNGVLALPPEVEIVAVHDAARPLIAPGLVERALQPVKQGAAGCVVGVPIRDTVKVASTEEPAISGTLDRSRLWRAQTPQVFLKRVLLEANQAVPWDSEVTDDAQLLEIAGLGPIRLLEGDERNLKITTPADLALAQALLALEDAAPPEGRQDVKNHC